MGEVPGDCDDVGGLAQAPHVDGVPHRVPVLAHVVREPTYNHQIQKYLRHDTSIWSFSDCRIFVLKYPCPSCKIVVYSSGNSNSTGT